MLGLDDDTPRESNCMFQRDSDKNRRSIDKEIEISGAAFALGGGVDAILIPGVW